MPHLKPNGKRVLFVRTAGIPHQLPVLGLGVLAGVIAPGSTPG